MKKELKYFFYVVSIIGFFIFIFSYYFSDKNKKNSYRLINLHDKKIAISNYDSLILESDTENIIEYVENNIDENKKKYNFWDLLKNDKK
tara:strand:- start:91 stop:357 length:267 start_codon:yes stop_codon:yes gene_type:complete